MNAAERLDTELAVAGTAEAAALRRPTVRRGVVGAFLHWLFTGHDPYLWPVQRT